MPKLSTAFAASALLIALSAPSFAADVGASTSQHGSAAVQNQNSTTDKTQLKGKEDLNGSASLNRNSRTDRDRDVDRDREQSAQMPSKDRDFDKDDRSPGRSGTSPGHEMQEHGSVPGSPGASGYAPGHSTR
jgi:hypothetical protein